MVDYYELLGVSRSADAEEIKRAYRRQARELHPDVAETGNEEKFKMLARAYEVLGNAENRRQYDMGFDPTAPRGGGFGPGAGFGGFPGFGGGSGFGGAGGGAGGVPFGFQDLFDTFFAQGGGGRSRGPVPRQARGDDAIMGLEVTLPETVFGAEREIEVDTAVTCGLCHGAGTKAGTGFQECSTCHGSGHVQRMQRSFLGNVMTTALCPDCDGHGTVIPDPCPECNGQGRFWEEHPLTINIPAGVSDGTRIRLTGQGEAGPGGGPAGDLYLQVHVLPDARFERAGNDLLATIEVPMVAAALGTAYRLDTLDGLRVIRVEPGTQPGFVAKLKGLGVGKLHGSGRGDLLVTINVVVPSDLTPRQVELLQHFSADRGEEQPPLPEPEVRPGLFGPRTSRSKKRKK